MRRAVAFGLSTIIFELLGCVSLEYHEYYAPLVSDARHSYIPKRHPSSVDGPPDQVVLETAEFTAAIRSASAWLPWLIGPDVIFPLPILPLVHSRLETPALLTVLS